MFFCFAIFIKLSFISIPIYFLLLNRLEKCPTPQPQSKIKSFFEKNFFIHFQKSGDKILTSKTHDYHIDWKVICQLAGLSGIDFIHAGMWGGYMNDDKNELKEILKIDNN